jgi:hypothetical protein
MFMFDETAQELLAFPASVTLGCEIAKEILLSKLYAQAFCGLVTDVTTENISSFLSSTVFTIKYIRAEFESSAWACVYRELDGDELSIFINPALVLEFKYNTHTLSSDVALTNEKCQAAFIAIKFVHQVSHILHFKLSASLQAQPKKLTPEKVLGPHGAKFTDIGDMIEFSLFGGICISSNRVGEKYFGFDFMVLLSHPRATRGHMVDEKCCDAFLSFTSSDIDKTKLALKEGLEYSVGKRTRRSLNEGDYGGGDEHEDVVDMRGTRTSCF